jgi:hypothetical protein
LAFFGGALAAYCAIQKKKKLKEYILLTIGLLSVAQIKDGTGTLVSLFVAFFIIVNEIVVNFDEIKKQLLKLIPIIVAPIMGYYLASLTIEKPVGYASMDLVSNLPVLQLIPKSISFILLAAMFFVLIILLIIFMVNKRKITFKEFKVEIYKLIIGALAITFLVLLYKFLMLFLESLPLEEMNEFIAAIRSYAFFSSGGTINIYRTSLIILIIGLISSVMLKKEFVTENITRSLLFVLNIIIYGFIILIAYSTGFDESGKYVNSISWERYTCVPFIIFLTYVFGYYISSSNIYTQNRYKRISIFLCLFLAINYLPYPGSFISSKYNRQRIIYNVFEAGVEESVEIISRETEQDNSIYVASYYCEENINVHGDYYTKWLRYEITPRKVNWNYGPKYSDKIGYKGTVQEYLNKISQYDYYYILSAGPDFYSIFAEIFPDNKYYRTNALYKVISNENGVSLSPVYIDDSKEIDINEKSTNES